MSRSCAELVADIRRRHGWTQQEMADQIGLSRSSVANIEADRQDMPGSRLLALLEAEGLLVDRDHPNRTIGLLSGQVQTVTALLRAAEQDAARYRMALADITKRAEELTT